MRKNPRHRRTLQAVCGATGPPSIRRRRCHCSLRSDADRVFAAARLPPRRFPQERLPLSRRPGPRAASLALVEAPSCLETAAQLGNTPAVCKASYIWPSVLRDFEQGRVLKPYYRTLDELVEARSYAAERALLELLKTGRSALPAPPQRASRPETKMGRRMRRSPRARRLARAFTLH